MILPRSDILVDYVEFAGGLDLESPILSVKPGSCLTAVNYETGPLGGYRRIDGYERYNGMARPSDATYYYCAFTPYEFEVYRLGTATRVDENGLVVAVPPNTPRINYNPVTLVFDEILLESARTNLAVRNTEFNNAVWTKTNVSVTPDDAIAPSGAFEAELIKDDTTAGAMHRLDGDGMAWPTAGAGNVVVSISAKAAAGTRNLILQAKNRDNTDFDVLITLATGAATTLTGSPVAAGAIQHHDGWWRGWMVVPIGTGGTTPRFRYAMCTGSNLASATYDGDGASGLYLWGAQVEEGSTISSLILTTSAAVTRNADVIVDEPIAVGQRVFGRTSGATAVVSTVGDGYVAFTDVVGTFVADEQIVGAGGSLPLLFGMTQVGYAKGELSGLPGFNGAPTGALDAVLLADAADIYRSRISAVPGSGPTRGVWVHRGTTYAMRDSADGTEGRIYRATTNGWKGIELQSEVGFVSGGTYEPQEGDLMVGNTSGANAVILRVVLTGGDFAAGTALGKLIVSNVRAGTFVNETVTIGAFGDALTVTGDPERITLLPGGRYVCQNYNFAAGVDTYRIYGCDGVNRGFELDQDDVYVPIDTGMGNDAPTHVRCHKKMLFFSFLGSSQNSGIGTPYRWSAILGASEIGIGDTITGYDTIGGDALIIYARNSTHQLLGSSVNDFVLNELSSDAGAIPYTNQSAVLAYCLDDRGVMQVARTQAFGNFRTASVSRKAQAIIDILRPKAIASAVYRSRDQYRVYGSDGTGVILAFNGDKIIGITAIVYPINITCACSGEATNGKDVVFLGDDDGYVYQADMGSSFDGEAIESYLILPFNNLKTPRFRKRFRKVVQEMSAVGYAEIRFQPVFSYGDEDVASHRTINQSLQGAGGYWDVSNWDTFYYDAKLVNTPEFGVEGTGINMGLIYYSNSRSDLGHTIQSALIHYTPRRLSR